MQTKNLKKLLASILTFALVLALVTVGTGKKEDWRVYAADPGNAQYSLEGAEYYIYTDSNCTTRAKDTNNKNAVLTTGADGTTNEVALFEGTYYVKEAKASKGYMLDTKKYKVVVEDNKVKWVNDGTVQEIPQSAPLSIQKVDKETGKPVAIGGASLADAQFQVVYTDGASITKTWVIKTDADGIAKLDDAHKVAGPALYKNSKNEAVVPLGKVTITEIEPSTGYLKNNGVITIIVGWDGPTATDETTSTITVSGATEGYALGSTKPIVIRCPEQVKRGDVEFFKMAQRINEPLSVPFVIKSKTTGEAHVAYANTNGYFSSSNSHNIHTNKTNSNDAIINPDGTPILDSNGWVDLSVLDEAAGIWFSRDKGGNVGAAPNADGALPYDSYLLIELPCERNDGYELITEEFEIKEDKLTVNKRIIEDPERPPTYNMYKVRVEDAASDGKGKFGFDPGDFVTYDVKVSNPNALGSLTLDVSDEFIEGAENFSKPVVISVKNAKQNSLSSDKNTVNITIKPKTVATVTYGALVLPKAKEYLADAAKDSDSEKDGVDCNKVDRNNDPDEKDGYRNMAYTTNVTYTSNDGGRTDKLEPKEDDAQTPVKVPVIGTTLMDQEGRKIVSGSSATLVDTVSYDGLTPGKTYVLECELMIKDTAEPLTDEDGEAVTARSAEFVPSATSGTATVSFTLDMNIAQGKELVAFETCYLVKDAKGGKPKDENGKEIDRTTVAEHKDLDDVGQTIEVPGYRMYKVRNENAPKARIAKYGFYRSDIVTYDVHITNISKTASIKMDVTDHFEESPEYFSKPKVAKVKNAEELSRSSDENRVTIRVKAGETAVVTYQTKISKDAEEYLAAEAKDSDSLDEDDNDCNKVDQANETDDEDGYRNIAETDNVIPEDEDGPLEPLEPQEDEAQTPVQIPAPPVNTGDVTRIALYAVLFIAAAGALAAIIVKRKRKEN